jgi:RNA polymerase sigma factor (sigma-70 family)
MSRRERIERLQGVTPECAAFRDVVAEVYRRCHSRLVHYAASQLHDRDWAEDLVQELYMRLPALLSADAQACDVDDLFPFLVGCLRKLAANARRRRQRRVDRLKTAPVLLTQSDPSDQLVASIMCGRVLSRLPASDAGLLRMKYLHDLTYEEISVFRKSSEGAARDAVYRARKRARVLVRRDTTHLT